MEKFIIIFRWAKKFNRNMYYCNRSKRYFYLGHIIPDKFCDLIIMGETSTTQQILLNQLK